jgi:hypothetical protein
MPSFLAIADFLRPQSLELGSTFIYGVRISFESFSGVDLIAGSGEALVAVSYVRKEGSVVSAAMGAGDASGRDKRSVIVHHRVPGKSVMSLMISLCPGCHAKVHRTIAVLSEMPALLLVPWREQHPHGHEQTTMDFDVKANAAEPMPLFDD